MIGRRFGNPGRIPGAAAAALLVLMALDTGPSAASEDWTFQWGEGFKLSSSDGRFKLRFGGRIQADWTFVDADPALVAAVGSPIEDGSEFRRARFFMEGVIYGNVEFKADYDFAGQDADFKDVYIGILDTPIGNVRAGHFKEPFGLEQMTSSNYNTFIERGLPDALVPARNTGVMLHDHTGDRFTWAAGLFREADDSGGTDDGEGKLNVTARVTFLPVHAGEGRRLLHLGLSYSLKDLGRDDFRFATGPEAHQAPDVVDTTPFAADEFSIYGAEIAWIAGRFWAAGEHMVADGDAPALGDPSFDGTYVQAGVFLTPDHRHYRTSTGTFDRHRPAKNFGEGGGAWEIAVRYSTLDLSDAMVAGGELENLAFAVNWYLNPATRLMFNYVRSERDDLTDAGADFFITRFQIDF